MAYLSTKRVQNHLLTDPEHYPCLQVSLDLDFHENLKFFEFYAKIGFFFFCFLKKTRQIKGDM